MKNLEYRILYKKSVSKDLKGVEVSQRRRLVEKIESKLSQDPYKGKSLKGEYQGLRSIRVGDYRVVYRIVQRDVVILAVGHRKGIYRRRE